MQQNEWKSNKYVGLLKHNRSDALTLTLSNIKINKWKIKALATPNRNLLKIDQIFFQNLGLIR